MFHYSMTLFLLAPDGRGNSLIVFYEIANGKVIYFFITVVHYFSCQTDNDQLMCLGK